MVPVIAKYTKITCKEMRVSITTFMHRHTKRLPCKLKKKNAFIVDVNISMLNAVMLKQGFEITCQAASIERRELENSTQLKRDRDR